MTRSWLLKGCGVTGCAEGEGTNSSVRAQHTDKGDLQRSLCLKNTKGLQPETTGKQSMGSGDLSSGWHACRANTLPAKPSPQLQMFDLKNCSKALESARSQAKTRAVYHQKWHYMGQNLLVSKFLPLDTLNPHKAGAAESLRFLGLVRYQMNSEKLGMQRRREC